MAFSRSLARNAGAHISAAPPRQASFLQAVFGSSKFPDTPLNVPLAGTKAAPAEFAKEEKTAKVTTLKSGIRVVSAGSAKPVVHVGVHIDAGSRYENASNHGITSFLETHAFKSTTNRSAFRFTREMNKLGAQVSATANREITSYNANVLPEAAAHVLASIADVMARSEYLAHEIKESKDLYAELVSEPNAAHPCIMDGIHAAAWKNNTYGFSPSATSHQLGAFTTEALVNHTAKYWTPNRVVVSAVGVEHQALVDMVSEYFSILPANQTVEKPAVNYTGGQRLAGDDSESVQFAVGFEAPSWTSNDVHALLVLQTLMGGGASFSAGGPGKGMYTRIYQNVLNGNSWMMNAKCEASLYNDAGLFSIQGGAPVERSMHLVEVLVKEAMKMTGPISEVELSRAKNQLKSSILFAMESRPVRQMDMAQQVLTFGKVHDLSSWVSKIDRVTAADLQRVAGNMFKSKVSVAATGNVSELPTYDSIAKHFSR